MNTALDTEQYRHECEVRWVAALPHNRARASFLDGVKRKRGHDAYIRLRSDVRKLMGLPEND